MSLTLPKQRHAVVEVIWDDAAAQKPEWTLDIPIGNNLVRSVGFLIYCKRDYVVIAQDLDGDGEHNGRTQIPRGMVKTIKVLRKKD